MTIKKHSVVTMHYTLTNENKQTLDSSVGSDPLTYLHGAQNIIPGLESALEGKKAGDKLNVTVPPEKAYGNYDPKMIQVVPKSEFQDIPNLQVGMQFHVEGNHGPMLLTIKEIKDKEVVLDANHPLAGATLHFEVEITEVRDATDQEIKHQHAHGHHGHDH